MCSNTLPGQRRTKAWPRRIAVDQVTRQRPQDHLRGQQLSDSSAAARSYPRTGRTSTTVVSAAPSAAAGAAAADHLGLVDDHPRPRSCPRRRAGAARPARLRIVTSSSNARTSRSAASRSVVGPAGRSQTNRRHLFDLEAPEHLARVGRTPHEPGHAAPHAAAGRDPLDLVGELGVARRATASRTCRRPSARPLDRARARSCPAPAGPRPGRRGHGRRQRRSGATRSRQQRPLIRAGCARSVASQLVPTPRPGRR